MKYKSGFPDFFFFYKNHHFFDIIQRGSETMSKIMITPSSKEMIEKSLPLVDAYLLSLKNFSVNEAISFEEDELLEIIDFLKKEKKEVFISLNKNMFDKDLKPLENILEQLEEKNVNGICFYDISIPSMMRRKKLKTPLLWSQEHFTTNYLTMNYWHEQGVTYALLSTEITKEEVETIVENTEMKLIMQVFGYVPMFYSKRPLISNYKETFKLDDKSKIYYMEKEGKMYPLIEKQTGFEGYYADILNAYEIALTTNVEYLLLSSFQIKEDIFLKVLKCYKEHDKETLLKLYKEENLFFDKKTVYRVKDL